MAPAGNRVTSAGRHWRALLGRLSGRLATSGPLPYWRYRLVLGQLPIACVDVLPVRETDGGFEIGLIKRHDRDRQLRWAMVGGGVHRGETVGEAIARHVRITLGDAARAELPCDEARPHAVGQYFPEPRAGYGHDPRKHAVALSYWAHLSGSVVPLDEAVAFAWFPADEIPSAADFGFGHELTVPRLVATLPERAGAGGTA
jgi:ADP-ribose pyrophosphatase YjhB (NUDIX family)